MKEFILRIKDWWNSLGSREKTWVTWGAPVACVLIIYQFILAPLVNNVSDMRERITSQQKTLVWMKAADEQIAHVSGEGTASANKTTPLALLSELQKNINKASLNQSLTQLKQSNNDAVDIQFKKVDFDKLIKLMLDTLQHYRVSVAQMAVTSVNKTGAVDATIVINTRS